VFIIFNVAKRCKTINPLVYEVVNKFTLKFEISPHLSVAKRGYVSKLTYWKSFSTLSISCILITLTKTRKRKIKMSLCQRWSCQTWK